MPMGSVLLHLFCMISSKPAKKIHYALKTDGSWVTGCPFVLFIQEQTMSFYKYIYFLIDGQLLYRILLFSLKYQHESAISIHISPPS